jgi:hypothetical protein
MGAGSTLNRKADLGARRRAGNHAPLLHSATATMSPTAAVSAVRRAPGAAAGRAARAEILLEVVLGKLVGAVVSTRLWRVVGVEMRVRLPVVVVVVVVVLTVGAGVIVVGVGVVGAGVVEVVWQRLAVATWTTQEPVLARWTPWMVMRTCA